MLYEVITQAELGKDVVAFNAPGFAGPTQSKGHHVGNYTIFEKFNAINYIKPPYRITSYNVCYTKLLRGIISLVHTVLLLF